MDAAPMDTMQPRNRTRRKPWKDGPPVTIGCVRLDQRPHMFNDDNG